jgi:hypothetical protein
VIAASDCCGVAANCWSGRSLTDYETGAMRRTHLRGHEKIRKRLLIHVGASNLSLLMRTLCGIGKPKSLQNLPEGLLALIQRLWPALESWLRRCTLVCGPEVHRRVAQRAARPLQRKLCKPGLLKRYLG